MYKVPCKKTMGMGDSCSEGWLCGACVEVTRLNAIIAGQVQPVTVPDGALLASVTALAHKWNADAVKDGFAASDAGLELLEILGWPNASPAAQGDAKELTVEDLYQMYRDSYGKLNCEVDPFDTLDEMEQKAWRNLAAAIAAKAAS